MFEFTVSLTDYCVPMRQCPCNFGKNYILSFNGITVPPWFHWIHRFFKHAISSDSDWLNWLWVVNSLAAVTLNWLCSYINLACKMLVSEKIICSISFDWKWGIFIVVFVCGFEFSDYFEKLLLYSIWRMCYYLNRLIDCPCAVGNISSIKLFKINDIIVHLVNWYSVFTGKGAFVARICCP
jgi:hypothetical protein